MSFTSSGILNIAARDKIKSISFSDPENVNDPKCFVISLEQETSGMTVTSCFLSRLSELHMPRAVPIDVSLGGCQPNIGPLKWVITFGAPYNMLCSVQPHVMSVCDIITYKVFHC